jgi:hypothetical protein
LRGVKHQKNIPATGTSPAIHDFTMSIDFPKEEERILARWKEIDAFLRQVELVRSLPTFACFEARGLFMSSFTTSSLSRTHIKLTIGASQKESSHILSTMARHLRLACPIMVIFWHRPSRTLSHGTGL